MAIARLDANQKVVLQSNAQMDYASKTDEKDYGDKNSSYQYAARCVRG